jgi:hypothetical protein
MPITDNITIMNLKWTVSVLGMIMILVISTIIIQKNGVADATPQHEKYALIVVSNITYIDCNEISKAISLYEYLIDNGWDGLNIDFYAPDGTEYSEGIANLSNVQSGMSYLESNNNVNKEVLVYISDHGTQDGDYYNLSYTDGNMSSTEIVLWLNNMDYSSLTMIMCGNHSGLAGSVFVSEDRDIICSMGECQECSPDEFNITRSLNDPVSDQNNDNIITFIEAYYHEYSILTSTTDQIPCLWQG